MFVKDFNLQSLLQSLQIGWEKRLNMGTEENKEFCSYVPKLDWDIKAFCIHGSTLRMLVVKSENGEINL